MKGRKDFDAIVIGSGAGGGASAFTLTQHGLKVLLLEAGPAYDPYTDYKLADHDWERSQFPEKVPIEGRQTFGESQSLDPQFKDLYSWGKLRGRMNPTDQRAYVSYGHVVGLGGSTLHYTGEAHRLNPAAMRMHSRFGVAADWPLTYQELEPYYGIAEAVIGVAGPAITSKRPRQAPFPLPAHRLSYASQALARGFAKLDHSFEPNSLAALSAPYDARPPCNHCGNCNRGCPVTDKGSADVTFIRKAVATGLATIETGCQVTRLVSDAKDRVSGVDYIANGTEARHASAPVFIVCCGAVETPRLLLNSVSATSPHGLANESGQVGRNLMASVFWVSSGLHPDNLGSHRGLPTDAICWDHNDPDSIPGVIGGCRFSPSTAEVALNGPIAYATRVIDGWGRAHKQRMREQFGHVLSLSSIGESLPNPRSFIDLDPQQKDGAGLAKARITSYLTGSDSKRLMFMAARTRELLRASGVTELVEEYGAWDSFNATQVFGTCRMGDDPASSVVNRDCRSHRWKNLFVMDASVFPSSGGGEAPSLTISALAIRASARLAGK